MFVYDDGRGKVTEYSELPGNGVILEYTSDDYIYYYDSEKNSIIRKKDGKSERVIEFKYQDDLWFVCLRKWQDFVTRHGL